MVARLEELKKLKSDGKISNEEFTERIEEDKANLDLLIAKSPVTVATKKIIGARAEALYSSLVRKRKTKEADQEGKSQTPN